MKHFPIYIILIFFVGCNNNNNNDVMKNYDFDNYTMSISDKWKKISLSGIDSNVYAIVTVSGDTIFSDFGKYSSSFKDIEIVFSKQQILKYKSMNMDTQNIFSSSTPDIDQAQGTFLKEYYYYDTINNRRAKIKVPKLYGKGQIGIHFDSLSNNNKLTIRGIGLNEEDQKLLLKSFNTIKFK